MAQVHQTAIIEGDVDLAEDVQVGPHCVLDGSLGRIVLGAGTKLRGNVWLNGPLTLGVNNTLYPFACLGFAPQDFKWDPTEAGAGLVIGDGNIFREQVTIHRATSNATPTTIGNENFFMAASHAGHDCTIGNRCVFANSTLLAGHVTVQDRVITGGNAVVHQFCRIGRGAMLSGNMGLGRDLLPFFMLTGINICGSINLIGLRRSGMSSEDIDDVKWVYQTVYRRALSLPSATEALRERASRPMVAEAIAFIEQSKRGICPASGQEKRN